MVPLKGGTAWAIAAGDLNGDGFDDLAVTYSLTNQLAILLGTCVR